MAAEGEGNSKESTAHYEKTEGKLVEEKKEGNRFLRREGGSERRRQRIVGKAWIGRRAYLEFESMRGKPRALPWRVKEAHGLAWRSIFHLRKDLPINQKTGRAKTLHGQRRARRRIKKIEATLHCLD